MIEKRGMDERDIVELFDCEVPEFPETAKPPPDCDNTKGWWPSLYPTQMKAFNCYHKFQLYYGERFSGKTIVALHRLVRHCWENWSAFGMIATITRTSATAGGAWEKLIRDVLPEWQEGLGLTYTSEKRDDAQNRYIKIANRFGGWSTIMLRSIPHGSQVSARFRGTEPSFILFDELHETDDPVYFTELIQQIGRRKGIKHQHFVGACNPSEKGKKHWVYQKFIAPFEDPDLDEEKRERHIRQYAVFHIPFSENTKIENPQEYLDTILEACGDDPTAVARLMRGEWVERQTGQGIFADYFLKPLHVRGDLKNPRQRLSPIQGFPITVGYDLGDKNQAIVFMQKVPIHDKVVWIVFDEIVTIGKFIDYKSITISIMKKMQYWCSIANKEFAFEHISDKSAYDRYRANTGSYDYQEIEKHSKEMLDKYPERFVHLTKPIKLRECPKYDGSVDTRVRMIINLLQLEEIVIDAHCTNVIDMFQNITAKKDSIFTPPSGSPWKHALDALSYPILYHHGGHSGKADIDKEKPKPAIYRIGI